MKIFFYLRFTGAMRFGDLPGWATDLTGLIRKAICFCALENKDQLAEEFGPLSFDLLWREPLFDQLIVNVYQPGEGICAHIDLMRFEDGIAIVSMESECVMHFSRADKGCEDGFEVRVPILLNPGSLLVLSGEARYLWKHEINRQTGFQMWNEKEIAQKRRTSVTLRKLCASKE
ncbi:hypothetical protein HPP92_013761 [Vanilla planifolia]|uniref:Fe2OG dioxygenase domain-containing protein n=1 Tax=Vanilla planifolia TaxID=51239 RepID=A0A835R2K5_VANPL|nr:hypothetical protein HPP92_013761 [Vanilla planifolia]